MRKKVMAAVLTAAMVASVSAMPQMVAAADDEFKIGLITDVGGVNDGSFNQSAWEGLEKAGEELGVEVNYLESATDADYQPNMETFVDEDYDLIISVICWQMLPEKQQKLTRIPNSLSLMIQASIFQMLPA